MSSSSVKLNKKRICRYVFAAKLWDNSRKRFGEPVDVLLDTGSFNTVIHETLVERYGVMLNRTMMTAVGGFKGESRLCVLHKLQIGNGLILDKVVALAVPFEGELKDHILLGANVTNNWHFEVSRYDNRLDATEKFSKEASARKYPYRYCFDNKGRIMAFQELENEE